MSRAPALVIPCYNEAARFDPAALATLPARGFSVLAVDDGSTDDTAARLSAVGLPTLRLPENVGKAEAVRAGLLRALAEGPEIVAFTDADLATPPEELVRLVAALTPDLDVVLGSRVHLAGRHIVGRPARHYAGRVFATFAAAILRTPFYDTQCGAKVFRVTPALRAALARPFRSRWAFDVELIGRLLLGGDVPPVPLDRFREVPLETWIDRGKSKVTTREKARTLVELVGIERDLRALRRQAPRGS